MPLLLLFAVMKHIYYNCSNYDVHINKCGYWVIRANLSVINWLIKIEIIMAMIHLYKRSYVK